MTGLTQITPGSSAATWASSDGVALQLAELRDSVSTTVQLVMPWEEAVSLSRAIRRAAITVRTNEAKRVALTAAQLAELRYYAGGPAPDSIRTNVSTSRRLVELGLIAPTNVFPYQAPTIAGLALLESVAL